MTGSRFTSGLGTGEGPVGEMLDGSTIENFVPNLVARICCKDSFDSGD
jgi:hypothetical protein